MVLEPPALEGSEFVLRCHVTHVFPVGSLVVTLQRGSRVIYSESLERFTGLDLANVTLTYEFQARPQDLWKPVTCHARLRLDGLVVGSSSAPVRLTFLGEASLYSWDSEGVEKGFDDPRRGHVARLELRVGPHASERSVPNSHLRPPAWRPASRAVASASIAAFVGILLALGVVYLRKYLQMQSPA